MAPSPSNPFDPDEFGDHFAEALAPLCDPQTEIDASTGESHTWECWITINGVDYHVEVTPVELEGRS